MQEVLTQTKKGVFEQRERSCSRPIQNGLAGKGKRSLRARGKKKLNEKKRKTKGKERRPRERVNETMEKRRHENLLPSPSTMRKGTFNLQKL